MIGDVFLTPGGRRWLLVGTAAVVGILEIRYRGHSPPWQLAVGLALLTLMVGVWLVNFRRPHWAWVTLLGALTISLLPFSSWALYLALFGTLVQAGTRLPTRQGLPIAAVTITVFTVVQWVLLPHQDPLALALGLMGWIALYGVGVSYRWLREEQARTHEALEQLRLSRAAQLESAKIEERARLAREIHDVLAHTLSALAVQLESARLLLEQRPGDPAAVLAVERAHRLAHDGLVEARRAVGTLRGGTLPGPDALRTLAADFEADAGVPCLVVVEGEAAPLSSEASLAVYRTAQEALTNVRRHARATSVTVRLRWKGDGAELTVEDEGEPKEWTVKSGYGLLGIMERAELLGGRLDAGPVEHGFRVRLWVPT